MFKRKIYVIEFEDGSISAYNSLNELMDEFVAGAALAVYELKSTGKIVESKRAVMDKSGRGKSKGKHERPAK